MEIKGTAVEWLIDKIEANDSKIARLIGVKEYNEIIKQTIEIEKEQIEKAYDCGYDDGKDEANGNGFFFDDKSDYYNQTFKK